MDAAEYAIRRGQRARELLNDEILVGAFAQIEADLTAAWKVSKLDAEEQRRECYLMLRALHAVHAELRRVMNDGAIEADRIEREQREKRAI